ncbi:hypothetical protein KIPB_003108 [Kipferlia bialata]|uniref:Kelch repeat type 1 n=1 Tax=Kipferlia bialata TaxID=797122 RepID=A0A9K3CRZ2_9EUKA|nr:hypothetical protein KIPB_003108 [Kipferlia bialata]|eukprot:g3108.t1
MFDLSEVCVSLSAPIICWSTFLNPRCVYWTDWRGDRDMATPFGLYKCTIEWPEEVCLWQLIEAIPTEAGCVLMICTINAAYTKHQHPGRPVPSPQVVLSAFLIEPNTRIGHFHATQMAIPMPSTLKNFSVTRVCGEVVVWGGTCEGKVSNTMHAYAIDTRQWTTREYPDEPWCYDHLPSWQQRDRDVDMGIPSQGRCEHYACCIQGMMLVVGGMTQGGAHVGTTVIYDPSSDTWRKGPPNNQPYPLANTKWVSPSQCLFLGVIDNRCHFLQDTRHGKCHVSTGLGTGLRLEGSVPDNYSTWGLMLDRVKVVHPKAPLFLLLARGYANDRCITACNTLTEEWVKVKYPNIAYTRLVVPLQDYRKWREGPMATDAAFLHFRRVSQGKTEATILVLDPGLDWRDIECGGEAGQDDGTWEAMVRQSVHRTLYI